MKPPAAQVMGAEHAKWAEGLSTGAYTLADVLLFALLGGIPPEPWLVARVHQAFIDHADGGRELADSFGVRRHGNEAQAFRSELKARAVFDLVMDLHGRFPRGHAEHLPLSRTDHQHTPRKTAYSRASEILKMAESTVIKHYGIGKELHERGEGWGIDGKA